MIKKALCSPRIYVAFLWVGFLLYGFSEKIKLFSNITGIAVSPWTFPFFTMETGSQIFIILGALLIFCDAPFFTHRLKAYTSNPNNTQFIQTAAKVNNTA